MDGHGQARTDTDIWDEIIMAWLGIRRVGDDAPEAGLRFRAWVPSRHQFARGRRRNGEGAVRDRMEMKVAKLRKARVKVLSTKIGHGQAMMDGHGQARTDTEAARELARNQQPTTKNQ